MKATNLDEYLTLYGPLLAKNAQLAPRHNPESDKLPSFDRYKRKPFVAQAHQIAGQVNNLRDNQAAIMCCKMGTGKTFMAIVIADMHCRRGGGNKPYRCIVMCPGHLVHKWKQEILETIPDSRVTMLDSCFMLNTLYEKRHEKPTACEWYIVGRERVKLGAEWRPGVFRYKKLRAKRPGMVCPKCGQRQRDKDGNYQDPEYFAKAQRTCKNIVKVWKWIMPPQGGKAVMREVTGECGERLWCFMGKQQGGINRFEPARFIQRRLKNFFDLFVLDEAHEEKSATSAQGEAAGCLAASCKRTLGLTGTLIGGLANHVRALLFRFSPNSLLADGLGWNNPGLFDKRYGRIERTITESSGETERTGKQSRAKGRTVREQVRPGVSPKLFGQHLIGVTSYMELEEISEQLPKRTEYTWPVLPDEQQAKEYVRIEAILRAANKQLLQDGNRALLGAMLQTLLNWIDYPFNWDWVGYWENDAEKKTPQNPKGRVFHKVVLPETLHDKLRPKEKKLIEIIKGEVKAGRQVWVYVQNTKTHDVQSRLQEVISDEGFDCISLRSSVEPEKREQWIRNKGGKAQVVISHPKLVETGLDLFDKKGRYNFPTLVFYETGYNLFTLRQAAARSWRIAQKLDCRVHYLFYAATIQEAAMGLMGRKLAAAQALEGKFTSDGLVALGGDDVSNEMALAKAIDQMLPGEAVKSWGCVAAEGALANADEVFKADEESDEFDDLAELEADLLDASNDDMDADDIESLLADMESDYEDDE
jgi:SNF2 family DNA or RNA helicase